MMIACLDIIMGPILLQYNQYNLITTIIIPKNQPSQMRLNPFKMDDPSLSTLRSKPQGQSHID